MHSLKHIYLCIPLSAFLSNHRLFFCFSQYIALYISSLFCDSPWKHHIFKTHYSDVIMDVMASKITNLTIVYSTVYSGAGQRKQSSASLAFVWGIRRWPVNSPHKGPVTHKIFPFDDVIMQAKEIYWSKGGICCRSNSGKSMPSSMFVKKQCSLFMIASVMSSNH